MKKLENILVWAGVHGDEYSPGVPLVKSLQDNPMSSACTRVEAAIAHPLATTQGKRFIDANLALCIGNVAAYRGAYEAALVPEILERSQGHNLVIDMHSQALTDQDLGYIGPRVLPEALGVLALAGIHDVLVCESGIQSQLPQCVLIDVAHTSFRNNLAYWRAQLQKICYDSLPPIDIEVFSFRAHGDLTTEERAQLNTPGIHYAAGQEIPGAGELLGITQPISAVFSSSNVIEISAPLSRHDINTNGPIWELPTLRMLAGGSTQERS